MQNPELRRALGPWATIAVVIGTAIGSGIFLVPTDMVKAVGSPSMVFAVWIFGGILTLFGALTYAELSATLPGAGGEYVYLNAAYGPFFGFHLRLDTDLGRESGVHRHARNRIFLLSRRFFPRSRSGPLYRPSAHRTAGSDRSKFADGQLLAIGVILFLAGVNYLGVRVGGGVQIDGHRGETRADRRRDPGRIDLEPGKRGEFPQPHYRQSRRTWRDSSSRWWPLCGPMMGGITQECSDRKIEHPQAKSAPGADHRDPRHDRDLFADQLGVFLHSDRPRGRGKRARRRRRHAPGSGTLGGAAVSVAAMISIFAALERVYFVRLARPLCHGAGRTILLPACRRVHPRFRTPGTAIVLLGVWSSLILLSGQYEQLYTLVIFPSWICTE